MQLIINNLHKKYDRLEVISGLDLDLSTSGIHCIFGPSGCGKTTLLKILAGLSFCDKGDIMGFDGKKISYIFQEERLLPWATVGQNVEFVLESHYDIGEVNTKVDKYLALVELLEFKNYYPYQLSGGMKQRVAIARAFAYEGDIVMMDEPFKGLHLDIKKNLINYIINYWHKKRGTFIFITHDVEEALYMANFIHIMQGPPLTIKEFIDIDIPHYEREKYKARLDYFRDKLVGNG